MALIRDVGSTEPVSQPTPPVSNPNPMEMSPGFVDKMSAAQMLGLENESDRSKYSNELDTIVKWAKTVGYENPTELKWLIQNVKADLGSPAFGEKWIQKFHVYAGIKLQEARLKKQEEALLKGFDSIGNE